jgi:molecular chaperone Hsp33
MNNDSIHRFSFREAPIRGQWVRLDATLAQLFAHQPYPTAVQALLAELVAAASLFADGIKFHGTVALQARGTGPVTTVLAECRAQTLLRGIARWQSEAGIDPATADLTSLLGNGQMTVSLLPDPEEQPHTPAYQGIVSLTEGRLTTNLEHYFANSEQLPTRLYLSFADGLVTGLLLQRLPAEPDASEVELDLHEALWQEVQLLADTLRREELSSWSLQELLRRLFHEHTLNLGAGRPLQFACTCSRARAKTMLAALPKAEILELLSERGVVDVTCEVCGARYEYDQIDTRALYETAPPRLH